VLALLTENSPECIAVLSELITMSEQKLLRKSKENKTFEKQEISESVILCKNARVSWKVREIRTNVRFVGYV